MEINRNIKLILIVFMMVTAIFLSCNNVFAADNTNTDKISVSQEKVVSASKNLNSYVEKHEKLPSKVNCGGYKLTIPEFTYLMAKTIKYKNNGDNSSIIIKKEVKYPNLPSGDNIKGKISSNSYNNYSLKLITYVDKYDKLPNYVQTSNDKKIQYQTYVYLFGKVLSHDKLPDSVYINVKKSSKLNKYSNPYIKGNAIWLWSQYAGSVNFNRLKKAGIGNILLLESAVSSHGLPWVIKFTKKAHKYGIKVHIWFCTFYNNGNWINPINPKTKSYNYAYFNKLLKRVKQYAKTQVIDGIHFDYVRYSGKASKHRAAYQYSYSNGVTGEKAITLFVKKANQMAKKYNKKIILSAALMPEISRSISWYGQNTEELGKYLDVLMPMVYKTAFVNTNEWVRKTTQWYVKHSNGAQVWTGLEVYGKNGRSLSGKEMISNSKAAIEGGADGLVLFRYKLWRISNLLLAY
ncbi:hypothetical protein MBCUT_18860 [Methanobrevibacter cuticularis]|uniref:DUF4015 domain-containing protein n=1 Tax=Methanobrevibacter cuticularis TaxID=47311 RepID=A0A166CSP9_9EURY|nr:putative glycoside hydrolase [Methanobrevibacter cuticularis]KZX14822.1 hypothetical protein MBCUT_18860 [Methanobrevibacter cuticularis]